MLFVGGCCVQCVVFCFCLLVANVLVVSGGLFVVCSVMCGVVLCWRCALVAVRCLLFVWLLLVVWYCGLYVAVRCVMRVVCCVVCCLLCVVCLLFVGCSLLCAVNIYLLFCVVCRSLFVACCSCVDVVGVRLLLVGVVVSCVIFAVMRCLPFKDRWLLFVGY